MPGSAAGRQTTVEPDAVVAAVAERLALGGAAAAQRERPALDRNLVPVRVDQRHVIALNQTGPIVPYDNIRQDSLLPYPIFCIDARKSALERVFPILSSSSSIASTGDNGFSTLRSTQTRLRSSPLSSNSSFRVPLF